MMQKIIDSGKTYMRHHRIALLSTISSLLLLLSLVPSAMADYIYLKPGESRTISVQGSIETVFVSNPAVADYKVLNGNRIIVYGKTLGLSEVTIYDRESKVLSKVTIEIDPVISDLGARIKNAFPNTNVQIKRLTMPTTGGSNATYLLSGTVPDEETADIIYGLVGQAISSNSGGGDEKNKGAFDFSTNENGVGATITKTTYPNVIKRFTFPSPKANQVSVQLTVIEVDKQFSDILGVEWNQIYKDINGINSEFGTNGTFKLLDFKGFDSIQLGNTIKALKDDDIAKILAQPTLTVLSGESAQFLVGGEVPITIRDSTNNSVSTSYKQHGIILNVGAKVQNDDKIRLYVASELSSTIAGSVSEYDVPAFTTRKSSSMIELANGQSFVIAGLLKEEDREKLSKIPYIGDIPILGALARSTSTNRHKTELIIFVTVNLVQPVDSVAEIEVPTFKKTSSTELFFNVGVNKEAREDRLMGDSQLNSKAVSFLDRGGFAK